MAKSSSTIDKLIEILKNGLNDVVGELAPKPDAIPIPVRDDPRRPRR